MDDTELAAEVPEQSLVNTEAIKGTRKRTALKAGKLKPFNKNWEQLAAGLGFGDIADCKRWRAEDVFNDHFEVLKNESIEPEKRHAIQQGRQPQRGPGLERVQKRLEAGEKHGKVKYSRRGKLDKSNWGETDHHALFLLHAVEDNTNHRNGVFFGEDMPLAERQFGIWQALLRAKTALSD